VAALVPSSCSVLIQFIQTVTSPQQSNIALHQPHSKSHLSTVMVKVYAYGVAFILLLLLYVFPGIQMSCGSLFFITGGSDYNLETQNFTIYSGERRCISVEILDDTIVEQNTESVILKFRTSPSYALSYDVVIYIEDNDGE